jgi:hypothetical protein
VIRTCSTSWSPAPAIPTSGRSPGCTRGSCSATTAESPSWWCWIARASSSI